VKLDEAPPLGGATMLMTIYANGVGAKRNLDVAIAIRTAVVAKGGLHIQAGAGIVFDSLPESELAECANKARALAFAARLAEGMQP